MRGRIAPFIIGTIGIAMGSIYSWLYLHKQIRETAGIALLSGVGANAIWFLWVLFYSTVRVPWLLDADSTVLINKQEDRAEDAEEKLAEIKVEQDEQALFGRLMEQGLNFSSQIATCHTDAHFASWDRHSNEWTKSVQQAMRDMGFSTDAVEFARAAEYASPVMGVISIGSRREERARVLEKRQEYLANFAHRRLS
jgi:hypothetical protein